MTRPPWVPDAVMSDDPESMLARHAELRTDLARIVEQYETWKAQLVEWFTKASTPLTEEATLIEQALTRWALAERERTGKASFVLPSGKVTTRVVPPTVEVTDEAAFLAWCEQYPATSAGMTKAKVVPVLSAIKAATGSAVRGNGYRATIERADGTTYTVDVDAMDDLTLAQGEGVLALEPLTRPIVAAGGVEVWGVAPVPERISVTVKPVTP